MGKECSPNNEHEHVRIWELEQRRSVTVTVTYTQRLSTPLYPDALVCPLATSPLVTRSLLIRSVSGIVELGHILAIAHEAGKPVINPATRTSELVPWNTPQSFVGSKAKNTANSSDQFNSFPLLVDFARCHTNRARGNGPAPPKDRIDFQLKYWHEPEKDG